VGATGASNVAWGNLERFAAYAAILNPWAPPALVPAIVWIGDRRGDVRRMRAHSRPVESMGQR
jgi:hypothetical protein